MSRSAYRPYLWTGFASLFLLIFSPGTAWAHVGVGTTAGLVNGFVHPIFGWDHLLAMVAVGLWAAQRGGRAVWLLPAAFVGTMALGGVLGSIGLALPGVEAGILASVLVLGALIAMAARFPLGIAVAVVALSALFHGHAHGAEMPQAVSGLSYGLGFCAATALLHTAGVMIPLSLRRLVGERQVQWIRLAGAGICAAGVILLAI
jgi:urease accessory protein